MSMIPENEMLTLIRQLHDVATGLANLTGRFDTMMEQMSQHTLDGERIARLEGRVEQTEAHGKELRQILLALLGVAATLLVGILARLVLK
jgi:hypothetical protein